jgi:uncharacterized metal-binding protein
MVLEKQAKEKLEDLLDMSEENFKEMALRWDELKPELEFTIKDSHVFLAGYVCGKIEHKFIDWFYSEFGRSQTDEEYKEFWRTIKKQLEKMSSEKWQFP